MHYNTDRTDSAELAEAVAMVLESQGYVACYNGSYMAVYDASESPARLLVGDALHSVIEDTAVALLQNTVEDDEIPSPARGRAAVAKHMLTSGSRGYGLYMREVVERTRNYLPAVEYEEVAPPYTPAEPQEANTDRVRSRRNAAEDDAVRALNDARSSGVLPAGRYAFTALWDWWKKYRTTRPCTGYHPDAVRVGRNRFYSALARLENAEVVTYEGRSRYIYLD